MYFFAINITEICNFFSVSDTKFACLNGCGKLYKYKKNMLLHYRNECGKEPRFKCQYCAKRFVKKYGLRSHVISIHKILM